MLDLTAGFVLHLESTSHQFTRRSAPKKVLSDAPPFNKAEWAMPVGTRELRCLMWGVSPDSLTPLSTEDWAVDADELKEYKKYTLSIEEYKLQDEKDKRCTRTLAGIGDERWTEPRGSTARCGRRLLLGRGAGRAGEL